MPVVWNDQAWGKPPQIKIHSWQRDLDFRNKIKTKLHFFCSSFFFWPLNPLPKYKAADNVAIKIHLQMSAKSLSLRCRDKNIKRLDCDTKWRNCSLVKPVTQLFLSNLPGPTCRHRAQSTDTSRIPAEKKREERRRGTPLRKKTSGPAQCWLCGLVFPLLVTLSVPLYLHVCSLHGCLYQDQLYICVYCSLYLPPLK